MPKRNPEREAAALRENLLKRKAQQRVRTEGNAATKDREKQNHGRESVAAREPRG